MKPIIFKDDFLSAEVRFFIGWDVTKFDAYLHKTFQTQANTNHYDGLSIDMYHPRHGSIYLVWTRMKIDRPYAYTVLAHECLHIVNKIFSARGVKLDPENDEPQCYYLDMLMSKALKI